MNRYPVPNGDYIIDNLVPQSQDEFAEFCKKIPQQIPSTHRAFIRWTDFEIAPGEFRAALSYGIEPIDPAAAPAATDAPPAGKTENPDSFESLNALKKADLITRGAELGLTLKDEQTKAAMVAKILDRLKERRQS